MLASATRAGTTTSSTKPGHAAGAVRTSGAGGGNGTPAVVVVTDGAGQQEVTVSQFVAQLDEAARRRLDSMHQRLRLLEQQMETLEAEVGKASSTSSRMDTYA
ncbi:hypothetical protein BDA96_03G274200 [Sorghum bicolor]|uniref:Uncharacterized protein n=2 Tax=Sorghum bicolor TaxID=4558 RepID=A0A921UPU3_SORBI|nr:uncharacterized protein LOC8068005 [Sorghum bicolor]EES01241.1 hypothetical protein SORBI_3003G253700 [Sorghum bicolor]KAG0538870.1 hypothetical protein BDA96_03G274200 [Sorghum bicolor]|eukprot:XP_002456121.1 uncharacterized protein LOC8068005 [Sorghum bicolor]